MLVQLTEISEVISTYVVLDIIIIDGEIVAQARRLDFHSKYCWSIEQNKLFILTNSGQFYSVNFI